MDPEIKDIDTTIPEETPEPEETEQTEE